MKSLESIQRSRKCRLWFEDPLYLDFGGGTLLAELEAWSPRVLHLGLPIEGSTSADSLPPPAAITWSSDANMGKE